MRHWSPAPSRCLPCAAVSNTKVVYRSSGVWLIVFVCVKWFGTALAGWSWWWVLMPIVPDVWLICQKAGLL